MTDPLIQLTGIRRQHAVGGRMILALDGIDLTIQQGEFVAIVGPSGSGKSTLLNIIGCLDEATSGDYLLEGRQVTTFEPDQLASLRNRCFGFVFQRYHLLGMLDTLANVEIAAVYGGARATERKLRAQALLRRLDLPDRTGHRPGTLSGGEQQRVSIARALMNDATILLADEPTGALDTQNGETVLNILQELNAEGRTIVIVTHDRQVAAHAGRIVEIRDGKLVSDRSASRSKPAKVEHETRPPPSPLRQSVRKNTATMTEAVRLALLAIAAHKLRSFLTMLGVIIGIAAVVCAVALGRGTQQSVLADISSLGTNTLEIFAGTGFGDTRSAKITTLSVSDARALAKLPFIAAATPTVSTSATTRYGSIEANAQVSGVNEQFFAVKGAVLREGQRFGADSVAARAQDVVIDNKARATLFPDPLDSPIGKIILVEDVPVRVIGVVESAATGFGDGQSLVLYMPYTTVQTRFLGTKTLRSITLQVSASFDTGLAQELVTKFLADRHGKKDFFILNTDHIRKTITKTSGTMAFLTASIAVISLIVGGIGVMNIMLVSVSERVTEIGVRIAVGARKSDIQRQFLIEAMLICLVGGVSGVVLALACGSAFNALSADLSLIYSPASFVLAVGCSAAIGVVFGYVPARNASRLNPVTALANG